LGSRFRQKDNRLRIYRRSMTCGYENPAHSGEKQIPLSKDAEHAICQ
jgi:hypothetical protein